MGKEYRKNLLEKSGDKLGFLSPLEQKILTLRYGLGVLEQPLKDIAKLVGVSEQTVRKYEAIAIRKLEKL